MPRGNRQHLPAYAWRITHRCHRQQFLTASDSGVTDASL